MEALPIEDEIWNLLKEWYGNLGPIDEMGLIEQRASVEGRHPLEVLRHMIHFTVAQGLWG